MNRHKLSQAAPILVFLAAFGVFAATASRSVDWYDSSRYSLAAGVLGIDSAPGSLILTLIGWTALHVHLAIAAAHALALVASCLGALTVTMIFLVTRALMKMTGIELTGAAQFFAALGALAAGFGALIWEYSVQFNPYILTTVMTGIILWCAMKWWQVADEAVAGRWLVAITFLAGIDFSIHRTNALILPGLVVWVMIRKPGALRDLRTLMLGATALGIALTLQLLIIPIAAAHPVINAGNPSNWPRFIDFLTMSKSCAHCFQILPRKSPFWSFQVGDFLQSFQVSFFNARGTLGVAGLLPGIFGGIGWWAIWRRDRRLAVAIAALVFLHIGMTILYFNIPLDYFRTLYRHYLPVFVSFGVLSAVGMAATFNSVVTVHSFRQRAIALATIVLLLLVPLVQLSSNWSRDDMTGRFFAEDYARNLLNSLPPNALLLTAGDNDTFPLQYLQYVEGVRRDVTVVNLSATQVPWYLEETKLRDPHFPLEPNDPLVVSRFLPVDTTLSLATPSGPPLLIQTRQMMAAGAIDPMQASAYVIIMRNKWQRAIAISTGFGENSFGWLRQHLRNDGLYWLVTPEVDPTPVVSQLRHQLIDTFAYRGYADDTLPLDDTTRHMGALYYPAFDALAEAEARAGDFASCRQTLDTAATRLPAERLRVTGTAAPRLSAVCDRPISPL